jgi:hypothetical protein
MTDIPAEIQTEHHPDTSLELYRYTNQLGLCIVFGGNGGRA